MEEEKFSKGLTVQEKDPWLEKLFLYRKEELLAVQASSPQEEGPVQDKEKLLDLSASIYAVRMTLSIVETNGRAFQRF